MKIEMLPVGQLSTNCYVVMDEDSKKAIVIDPGGDAPAILQTIERLQADVEYVVLTHGHFDHTLAVNDIKAATGAKLVVHPEEVPSLHSAAKTALAWLGLRMDEPQADVMVNEGDELKVGSLTFKVLHTPGHSPGAIALLVDGQAFVGDTLFAQGIGRTDLPGGSYEQIMESIHSKLLSLDDATKVYSGHGPVTTIGQERRGNPWLTLR